MPQFNHSNRDERGYFLPGHKLGGRPIGRGNKDYKVHKSLKEVREALKTRALIDAEPLYAAVRDKALKTGSEKKAEYCNKFAGLHKDYIETDLPPITDTPSALTAIATIVSKVAAGELSVEQGRALTDSIAKYVTTSMRGKLGDGAADLHGIFNAMIRGVGISDLSGQVVDPEAKASVTELIEEGVIPPRGMPLEAPQEPQERDDGSDPMEDTLAQERAFVTALTDAQRHDINHQRQQNQAKADADRRNKELGKLVNRD